MRELGWDNNQGKVIKIGGRVCRGYLRGKGNERWHDITVSVDPIARKATARAAEYEVGRIRPAAQKIRQMHPVWTCVFKCFGREKGRVSAMSLFFENPMLLVFPVLLY
jgi:hypothetical protein